ncbi:MAG: peroxide stress protein YaaA [Pseudohongiellaceae bacterium]
MIIVVSPAKSLDFETPAKTKKFSEIEFLSDSKKLMKGLKKYNPEELSELMHMSNALGELNFARNANWKPPFTTANAKQAVFAFQGDVYQGMKAEQYSASELNFAQKHLRILSGLYGLLKPLDLIQPYRLEMGSKFANERGKNLYEFWGSKLTDQINEELSPQKSKLLVNLASNEYFSAIKPKQIEADIVTPVFKDYSNGKFKVISFFAKKARGEMVTYIVENRIKDAEQLTKFDVDGYRYSTEESTATKPVFLRKPS